MADRAAPIEIGIVVRDEMWLSIVHGVTDLFEIANDLARARLGQHQPVFRISHFSDTGANGIERTFDTAPDASRETMPTVVIIPPGRTVALSMVDDPKLSRWLFDRHAEGAVLASVCGGAFLLAHTGLLDGRRATTHWICAAELAAEFPKVHVDADQLMIDDGDLITVGGIMAWADLGLNIVNRLLGPAAMMETARFMMIDPPGREQRFYKAFLPKLGHGDAAVLKVQVRMQTLGPSRFTVADMAGWSGLEMRTFVRRFHGATGLRPNEYHQHMRIEKAREALETTTATIAKVAWDSGYGDPASFRLLFNKLTGLSPRDYRKRFGHSAQAA